MDKKSVRAVAVTIFSGVLFLESMFAGGVASEETGKVLDGMRGLRRVNNVHYLVTKPGQRSIRIRMPMVP